MQKVVPQWPKPIEWLTSGTENANVPIPFAQKEDCPMIPGSYAKLSGFDREYPAIFSNLQTHKDHTRVTFLGIFLDVFLIHRRISLKKHQKT